MGTAGGGGEGLGGGGEGGGGGGGEGEGSCVGEGGGGGEVGGEPAAGVPPQYVLKVRPHAFLAHLKPPSIWRVVHAAHATALFTLSPVFAVHADGLVQDVPPPHSMWTVRSPEQVSLLLELVGVCLSAIMPSCKAEVEYLTYMSDMEELWNDCLSISEALEVSSPHEPSKASPFHCSFPAELTTVQAGGSPASVPAMHAKPMAQTNTEASRFGTAARLCTTGT